MSGVNSVSFAVFVALFVLVTGVGFAAGDQQIGRAHV